MKGGFFGLKAARKHHVWPVSPDIGEAHAQVAAAERYLPALAARALPLAADAHLEVEDVHRQRHAETLTW